MYSLIHQTLGLLPPSLRRHWYAQAPLGMFAAGLEAMGMIVIYLLIARLIGAEPGASASSVPAWFTPVLESGLTLTHIAVIGVLFFVLKNATLLAILYYRYWLIARSTSSYAGSLLRAYLGSDYHFHLKHHSSELIRNTLTSPQRISELGLGSVAQLLQGGMTAVTVLAVTVWMSPLGGSVTAAAAAVLVYFSLRRVRAQIRRHGTVEADAKAESIKKVQQMMGALKEIRVSGREQWFLRDFHSSQDRYVNGYSAAMSLSSGSTLVLETLFVALMIGIMSLMLMAEENPPGAVIAVMTVFAYAGLRLIPVMKGMMLAFGNIDHINFALRQLLDHAGLPTEQNEASKHDRVRFDQSLTLKGVEFRYGDAGTAALKGIDLQIERGESIGFVGATGAGKSTLMLLLLGLLRPTKGVILADGVDISARQRAWRQGIGYVPQSVYLLDDSVRANIALGEAAESIDEQRIAEVLELAQLHEVVAHLPQGLETRLGENGLRLSGGERQRLALARALYQRPSLLLLDEAMSALDQETEHAIRGALNRMRGAVTVIHIAHRLNSVVGCDRLVMLEQGRVSAVGNFNQLYRQHTGFRRMVDLAKLDPPAAPETD